MTLRSALVTVAWLAVAAPSARAQSAPPIGVRAAGMGGAFTAVADDATAPFWNPAGLASGTFAGLTLDGNSLDRQSGIFLGLATPPLGLCYYRTTSTPGATTGRNEAVVSSAIHHAGVTLVQSLGDRGIAVGSTLKYVHGNGASAFDADAGVMVAGSLAQIGVAVHNVFAPSLGDVRLDRRVRAGVAIHVRQDLTAAGDVEFTKTASPTGKWRDAALGLEAHPVRRAWLRGGVHWNTAAGDAGAAPVGSVGGSLTVYGGLRADAQVSFGSKEGDRGWGLGLSFVY
jgi:urease beta subunit